MGWLSVPRALAFSEVIVIDEDLGLSGGGTPRAGFERLLALVCEGRVGAVFSIEASRLARNGRDWHTLLICVVWWAPSSWTKMAYMIQVPKRSPASWNERYVF